MRLISHDLPQRRLVMPQTGTHGFGLEPELRGQAISPRVTDADTREMRLDEVEVDLSPFRLATLCWLVVEHPPRCAKDRIYAANDREQHERELDILSILSLIDGQTRADE